MTSPNLIDRAVSYLTRYMVFPSPDYATVTALYAAATHLWPHFDAFPYLHITATTKRSGKTRLSELLAFMCANSRNFAAATPATIFNSIKDEAPTIFMDEIEMLSSESASVMRSVLNVGYRRGQTVPRMGKNGVTEWPAYCPKVFIGIGDLYDTLRDRTVVVKLVRGVPPTRFLYDVAKADGEQLRDEMHDALKDLRDKCLDAYATIQLQFLTDRDEEIWLPLFAVCAVLAPEAVTELKRIAVDMATEKTGVARRHVDLEGSEEEAADAEYSVRLLRDIHDVLVATRKKYLTSAEAIELLRANPIAPWRKFRSDEGLTVINMSDLLSRFGVAPKNIKVAKNTVRRGYRLEDVNRAIASLGVVRNVGGVPELKGKPGIA